jgi:hypothetical protein
MKTGIQLIEQERERQISQEGWTPEHDDSHDGAEMVRAACCYAHAAALITTHEIPPVLPGVWPWAADWWKPSEEPIRNLVKAGALIAAEIDRLQRAQP